MGGMRIFRIPYLFIREGLIMSVAVRGKKGRGLGYYLKQDWQLWVMLLPAIVASLLGREGEFLERSDIAQVFKAREVRVTADPPLTIQFDGEPTGITTPFSARVLPGAVNLIVTEQEYERAQG
jgi:diacylglycerol kinase family enzyme